VVESPDVPRDPGEGPEPGALLGLPAHVPVGRAAAWEAALARSWASLTSTEPGELAADLRAMGMLFNPAVKGETLRQALDELPATDLSDLAGELPVGYDGPGVGPDPDRNSRFLLELSSGRQLVTPEGRVLLECLRAAPRDEALVTIRGPGVLHAVGTLLSVYREWSTARLAQATALLDGSAPSSMRPAVLGLLLLLLVNRNTAQGRALPKTRDRAAGTPIAKALALPVSAFAQALAGGTTDAERAVDLYRGWAWGELSRRLGRRLHNDFDGGIWLDPDAAGTALDRLCDDLAGRPQRLRERVPEAVAAAMAVYEEQRPYLTALGVAHDRPSNTRRILDAVARAATDGPPPAAR